MEFLFMIRFGYQTKPGGYHMPEFIIHDSIWDMHVTVISKDRYSANMALFQYLTNRGEHICVLKHGFLQNRYIVIGDQSGCDRWLKEEYVWNKVCSSMRMLKLTEVGFNVSIKLSIIYLYDNHIGIFLC